MELKSRPDVKSYLNVSQYLQDIYNYRKLTDPNFSYSAWATELELPSKSYLRFVTLGKRKLSESLTERLCKNLELSAEDREYFVLLVLYSQAAGEEQKRIYGKRLIQNLRSSVAVEVVQPEELLLADPLTMTVRNLLSFKDIERTPEHLSRLLSIPQEKVEGLLQNLQKLHLAQISEGQWQANHNSVQVKPQLNNRAVLNYHKKCLQRAIDLQDSLTPEERYYRSISLAVSESEMAEVIETLNRVLSELFAKFDGDIMEAKRLFQVNLNLTPWTTRAHSVNTEA